MFPPESTIATVPPPLPARRPAEQRRHADGARTLDHELGALQQEHHRLGDVVLVDDDDLVDQRSISASVSSPGRLTAMPSAIVSAGSTATGSPSRSESANGAQAAAWTPTTSTSGRCVLIAIATPLTSPPPPTGTMTLREVRHVLEQLEPERALAGDHVEVVERVHERRPAVGARACAAATALVDCRAAEADDRRRAPRAASTLAIGASSGMKTSHADAAVARPRRPAPGRGCRRSRRRRRGARRRRARRAWRTLRAA